jgi:hypothetical protein
MTEAKEADEAGGLRNLTITAWRRYSKSRITTSI